MHYLSSSTLASFQLSLFNKVTYFSIISFQQVMRELAKNEGYSELLMQNSAIPALHKAIQNIHDAEVQTAVVDAIANIAAAGPKQRQTVGSTNGNSRRRYHF
jgi:vacuolar-type H+-ATPase subunit F/Vma7